MLENLFKGLTLAEETVPNGLVVAMGVGTVFLGLISIVFICKIMSLIFSSKKDTAKNTVAATEGAKATAPAVIENRQEIVAAVSAVIAEELGTDVSAIRILSFKKI